VYSRLHGFIHFSIALALGCVVGLAADAQTPVAQAQTPAASASAATATLRGRVADPTGALIPGTKITIATPAGTAVSNATADASGSYAVNGLKPGSYIVQAFFAGFAPFTSPAIQLAAGQVKRVDISMAIEIEQQSVTVTDDSPTVSVEAGGNASAIVIKGKDLEALSDDPDELSNELTALAGPSAGPNGGQIYIDGFTGGQLPPKSAIREIRINQNPFSAEFDRLGYGRIEILTKPGTDKLHGQFFMQGNDNLFNTGTPFPTSAIPSYHSIQYNGTLNGALSKWASFFISVEQRNNQNDSIYSLYDDAAITGPSPYPYQVGSISGGLFAPQTRTNIAPRIDLQLGQKNTLTARYQFYRNNESGRIGSTSLPSQSSDSLETESTVQVSDSWVISDHIVNETRFQYLRDYSATTPVSPGLPLISVPGSFTGGGNSGQNETDHTNHFELQNITTMTAGKQAIKFGTRLRDNRDANSTDANFNGSFTFNTPADYVGALNQYADSQNHITFTCPPPTPNAPVVCGTTNAPTKLTYTTGPQGALANVFDAALFFQDDWKANKNLTLSGGIRWESQNHIADHDDWAPRVAFAYALDGHKDSKQAKTVLRGGFGIFYDRFSSDNMLSAERFNGSPNSQQVITIVTPDCFNPSALSISSTSNCNAAGGTRTVYQVAPGYHSPYTQQAGVSLERQLTKTTTLTGTYLHSFGVHQYVTRDANAICDEPNCPSNVPSRPDPSLGIVNQFYPEAVFKQNQIIVNLNAHFTPNFGVTGFYNFTVADSDGGNGSHPSNSYNLSQDYGRASFASRNMVFLMANYQGPWAIRFNPFMIAQTGKPFNITTTNDLTGDNFFNDRPSLVADTFCVPSNNTGGIYAPTSFGCLDTEPATPGQNYSPIPVNLGTGPAAFALNLRVSRAIGFGPKLAPGETSGPPQTGGGGGRGFGNPFGGGGGRGGGLPPVNTGRKYTLSFNVQAMNLFNDIDRGTPEGSVIPTKDPITGVYDSPGKQFGYSPSLAGGFFSSGSAARRIFFQATFAF
jgi:hypothetical protein